MADPLRKKAQRASMHLVSYRNFFKMVQYFFNLPPLTNMSDTEFFSTRERGRDDVYCGGFWSPDWEGSLQVIGREEIADDESWGRRD